MFFNIPPSLYQPIFIAFVIALCLFISFRYTASDDNENLLHQNSIIPITIISLIIMYVIGFRPVSGYFGDTINYARSYKLTSGYYADFKWDSEWLFGLYTSFCKNHHWSVNTYFFWIEVGYIGFHLWACKKLIWENVWVAMLFMMSGYSFYSYSVNGLRNGLACAMILTAIAYVTVNKNYLVAAVLAFLAMGIHRSISLPIFACVMALSLIKNTKVALGLWLLAIPLSLLFGEFFIDFFESLGFDERSKGYFMVEASDKLFSHTGFRWDFLLYSAMPVLMIYIVEVEKGIKDEVFHVIATVYLLCNAFWILVITANFSNRFAYLSWFIYPLVLGYPLIRMKIWEKQDRVCGGVLALHALFTLVMFLIGK